MTREGAYEQILKDAKELGKSIIETFKQKDYSPIFFTGSVAYEKFILQIFEFLLLEYYPEMFITIYVTGDDYKRFNHSFVKWVHFMKNGDINHWLEINHLSDADKYTESGVRLKSKEDEVGRLRYEKALELYKTKKDKVLLIMLSIVNPKSRSLSK